MWNGVNFVKTASDGTLAGALEFFKKEVKMYRSELALERTPKEDWLIVTVDYHS